MNKLKKQSSRALLCLLFFMSFNAYGFVGCPFKQINLFDEMFYKTANLIEVVEATKDKEKLMDAKIKYGFIGLNVGNATIYLNTSEGKIVDLNVDANINVVGLVKERIQQRITLYQIKRGRPLKFQMQGSERGVLIVQPGNDMNEYGGSATLKIWNGSKYSNVDIVIRKVNDKFRFFKVAGNKEKKITGLSVTMGGTNISRMFVSKYKIQTE
jgi:hypothetical protein